MCTGMPFIHCIVTVEKKSLACFKRKQMVDLRTTVL
jgi:hypothetical protein